MRGKKISGRRSLDSRLKTLTLTIMLPFTLLIIYLIITLINFCNSYNQSVSNINMAASYSIKFKDDIDYTMYRLMIGTMTMEELKELGEVQEDTTASLKDPYILLEKCRSDFMELSGKVSNEANVKRSKNILKLLDNLEGKIDIMDKNTKISGTYEENKNMLDLDIRTLTSLIQNYIQNYIYDETKSLEVIRVQLLKKEQITLIIVITVFIIILFVSFYVSRRITKSVAIPIQKLCEATDQIAQGDFTSTTEIESGDEIQVLTNSFNDMKGKIGELIENIRMEQNNLRVLELKLLQEQINPHFLYNTMDTIICLAEGNRTKEVVSMVTSLSEFFRTVLSEGQDYITIREEEKHIRSYLDIQHVRYQDIMEYDIQIEPDLYDFPILKLTLQPLLENALYHGIKNQRGKGKIKVSGYAKGNDIIFEVEDNGIGMKKEELAELYKKVRGEGSQIKRAFGLANVDERLRRNYGEGYGIHFKSEYGRGMRVTIRIPKTK